MAMAVTPRGGEAGIRAAGSLGGGSGIAQAARRSQSSRVPPRASLPLQHGPPTGRAGGGRQHAGWVEGNETHFRMIRAAESSDSKTGWLPPQAKVTSEADEHEKAMALEMGYQRRQWDKMMQLEKQIGEQEVKMQEFECSLQEQIDKNRNMEKQVEFLRREANVAQVCLVEHCNDERDIRQKELQSLRASIKALEGMFDDMLCEAVWDLTDSHHKGQQELRSSCDAVQQQLDDVVQHLGSKCNDLERLFREECTELVRGCTGGCSDMGREVAEERDTRQKELHGLRASIKALEGKFDDMLREAVQDLTDEHRKGQQELRSSCDAAQLQHDDLVHHLGSKCKDLERLIREECTELFRGCTVRCADLGREAAEERDTRQKELHGLRASIKDLEAKFDDRLHGVVRDLTDSRQDGHQELRSSCEAVQRRQESLVQEFSSRCKDLEHLFSEELRSSISGLERKSHETVREATKDLSELVHSRHGELAARIGGVEDKLVSHTHEFTSTEIYRCCDLIRSPSASSPTAVAEMQDVCGRP